MGSAVPVIGLGLQAVGMFGGSGGGTQYSPDPKAKYQADLLALSQAEQNARAQEALLYQQKDVANQLSDYQRESQYWQAQNERDLYRSQIEQQYQASLYNNNLQRTQAGMQNLASTANNQFSQMGLDAQTQSQIRNNNLNNAQSQLAYGLAQGGRDVQRLDARTQNIMAQQNNALRSQGLDLQNLGIDNQAGQLDLARQGVDLDERALAQQESQARQGFTMQDAATNVGYGQAVAQANLGRQANWNQLLNTFLGNSEQGKALMSRMEGMGLLGGTQGAQITNDLNLDPRILAQQQLARSQYGNQLGDAAIARDMGLASTDMARSNMTAQGLNARAGLGLQRQGLNQQGAGLSAARRGIDLERENLRRDNLNNEYRQESFINNLNYEGNQDYLQRVLFPDMLTQLGNAEALNNQNLQSGQIDLNQSLQSNQYQQLLQQLALADQMAGADRQGGLETLDADLRRQIASMDAARNSTRTSNDMALASQLSQLASSQYGLLSAIGAGLSNPAPRSGGGGGGIGDVLGQLGGLLGQAAQTGLLSGGGGRTQQRYTMGNTSYGSTPSFTYNQPNYSNIGTQSGNISWLGR